MATPERPETSVTNVVETCPPRGGLFPTTRWTLVLAAGAAEGKFALAQLCEAYWYPVYGYIEPVQKLPSCL